MAIQTIVVAQFDDGRVRYEIDYDDVRLFVTAIRCANQAAFPSQARIWNVTNPAQRFPTDGSMHVTAAGTTEQISVPQGQSVQLVLGTHNGQTVVTNLDGAFQYPA